MDSQALFILLAGFMLIYLMISFFYFYQYAAQKEALLLTLKLDDNTKQKKRSWREMLKALILSYSHTLGPFSEKVISSPEKDGKWLIWAGKPLGLTVTDFYGLRALMTIIGLLFGLFYLLLGLPFATFLYLLGPVIGFLGTNLWLRSKAKGRQEEISVNLPDFLDTVSIALTAGASLLPTLEETARKMGGPLGDEMMRMIREINLGVSRRQAYQNLIDRNKSKELADFIQSLIQGSDLGVPIATTFRIQADDMRTSRVYRAKEKAAKANPKVTLVTTLMITPAIFLFIIGLLFLNFFYNPDTFGMRLFIN